MEEEPFITLHMRRVPIRHHLILLRQHVPFVPTTFILREIFLLQFISLFFRLPMVEILDTRTWLFTTNPTSLSQPRSGVASVSADRAETGASVYFAGGLPLFTGPIGPVDYFLCGNGVRFSSLFHIIFSYSFIFCLEKSKDRNGLKFYCFL